MGEDEGWWVWLVDGPFFGPRCGVLTSSVFMILFPFRVTVWTSFSSLNLLFALIFFGFEASDIVRTRDNFSMNKTFHLFTESPYGKTFVFEFRDFIPKVFIYSQEKFIYKNSLSITHHRYSTTASPLSMYFNRRNAISRRTKVMSKFFNPQAFVLSSTEGNFV